MALELDDLTSVIIGAAIDVHRRLGPGLHESVYERELALELERRGVKVERNKQIAIDISGRRFNRGLRVDLLVANQVVVEVKSVAAVAPVHRQQLLAYLRLLDLRVGLLFNFNAPTLREGLHRIVNRYEPTSGSKLTVNRIAPDTSGQPPGPE